ncbi:TQXA domain-containing protein, partial [Bacillus cereus]
MKRKNKKIAYIVLMMLVIQFLIAPISGYAQSVQGNLSVDLNNGAWGYGVNPYGKSDSRLIAPLRLNGNLVFCIEPYMGTNGGSYEGYPDSDSISRRALLATALWDKVLNPNSANDIKIAQAVVWNNLDGGNKFDVTQINFIDDTYFNTKKQELNNLITNYDKKPSFDGQTVKLKLGETTEIPNTVAGVDLREFDKQVSNSANVQIETKQDKLLITPTDRTKKDGNLIFKKSYKEGTPYIYKKAGWQTVYEGKIKSTNSYTLNFDIETPGRIEITKVDENKKTLEGVEFTVFTKDDREIAKVKTDKNGVAKIDNLLYNDYYFKETKSLPGYVINSNPVDFSINENEQIKKITVENKFMRGSIEVFKVDADKEDKPLAGVEFTLFDKYNTVIGEPKLTDENGKVSFDNLPYGTYYLKETKTIEGYNLKQEAFPINVNNQVVNHTVTNKVIRGNVELLKVDIENKDEKLEGAEFELRNSNNEIISTRTTDKNGKLVINDLEFGKYKLIETKAPTGFVLDQTPIEFSVTEEGKTISLTKENKKIYGDLKITKVDIADENKKLANAKFEIYNAKGDKVVENVTDENGVATFEHLAFGKYTFKEVVAPEGYFINETVFDFEIREDGEIIQRKVEDETIPSIKTTATDKADGTKEMHANKTVTIQDKVEYKDLLVGKEYLVKGKLMDKATNQPLLVDGKEVTAEEKLTPEKPTGSITLDFTFDATGLEEKEVVVFEDLIKAGKTVTTHTDINDESQTIQFVKPAVQTTATDKADGTKELHTT